jgi:hypothetical protein
MLKHCYRFLFLTRRIRRVQIDSHSCIAADFFLKWSTSTPLDDGVFQSNILLFCHVYFPFFTKMVMAMGVREPEPNILPPSLRLSSPLVR